MVDPGTDAEGAAGPTPVAASGTVPVDQTTSSNVVLQLADSLVQQPETGNTVIAGVPENALQEGVESGESSAQESSPELSPQPEIDKDVMEAQLIGLKGVFRLQDAGDARLTDQEQILLRRQLQQLPPEEAVTLEASGTIGECKLCWSIIYRPLIHSGNL